MSTLRVNTVTNLSSQINVGKVVTTAYYTDSTNLNTQSTTFVTAYTFPTFTKKYDASTSTVYGFCSISTLFEGSEQQNWKIDRGGTSMAEILHRNASLSGWGMHNAPLHFTDAAPAGALTYTLQVRVVSWAWYNYPTNWGNGRSHYILMEVLN